MKINPRRPPTPTAPRQGLDVLLFVVIFGGSPMNGCQWVTILGLLGGCIYVLGVPWGMLHLDLHEILLGREANLVSIKSALSSFPWFAALPCRRHISHVWTPNNANLVSKLCATKLSSTLVFIAFLGNEDKIPKQSRKIICLISDLSAQLAFRGSYLLAPWPELGLPYVQIEAIVEAHNFDSQTFAVRGRLSLRIYIERACCSGLWEYLSGWVDVVGKPSSPRSFTCWCFGPWVIWSCVHLMS
jgi:hypothetical protein